MRERNGDVKVEERCCSFKMYGRNSLEAVQHPLLTMTFLPSISPSSSLPQFPRSLFLYFRCPLLLYNTSSILHLFLQFSYLSVVPLPSLPFIFISNLFLYPHRRASMSSVFKPLFFLSLLSSLHLVLSPCHCFTLLSPISYLHYSPPSSSSSPSRP